MDPVKVRRYGFFGILAPVVGFIVIIAAILSAQWFNWWTNALSDLGETGLSALIFNNGLKVTAFLMGIFALGLREIADGDRVGLTSFILFILGTLSLLGVGVFPITERPYHWYFSVAFFVFMPLSLFSYAVYLYKGGLQNLGKMSAAMGLVAALIWIPSWDGVAIPETISALAYAIWAQLMGVLMVQMPLNENESQV
jgi:hypothetical membrane protein